MKKLSLLDKILFLVNVIFGILMAISFFVPYVPVKFMPTISVVSLVVPFLVYINIIFLFYWSLRKKKQFLLSFTLIILWYVLLGPFYQFSIKQEMESSADLTVMSFNVRSFNKYNWIKNPKIDDEILTFVKNKNPDILCFQEFSMIKKRKFDIYPYSYETPKDTNKSFQIVFSKYPIVKGGSLSFPKTINNGIFVDVIYSNDTIRVYDIHLQSFSIVPEINTIKNEESAKLLAKSRKVMLKQYEQAKLIRESMESTNHKKIMVGDFNNTQFSNVYRTIKGSMNDTFLEKGKGFGRSYNLLGFPIRIDYILSDPEFEVISHENFDEKLSDHYPVMATLRLKSD